MNKLIPFVFLSSVLLLATSQSTFYKSVNAQSFQRNRPDLNGLLIRNPGDGSIYWIEGGQRRPISGPDVYRRLFLINHRDYLETDVIELGPRITKDNRLVRCGENTHPLRHGIFLLDQGKKRPFDSPTAMKKYNINPQGVVNTDCAVLATIPDGSRIR